MLTRRKTISWQPLLILLFCLWTVLADSDLHHHRHHHLRHRRHRRQQQQCPCAQQLSQLSRQDVTTDAAVRHRRSSSSNSNIRSSEAVTWPVKRVAEIEGKWRHKDHFAPFHNNCKCRVHFWTLALTSLIFTDNEKILRVAHRWCHFLSACFERKRIFGFSKRQPLASQKALPKSQNDLCRETELLK